MPQAKPEVCELHSGDHMTREEFHRIYEQMPEDFRAELIGGIVYVSSPMRKRHANRHVHLSTLFGIYEMHTPGVEAGDNGTLLLGDDAEPQPDLYLRILPEFGGQSGTTESEYVDGAPELVAELAHSTHAIDLHEKRDDYARYGVLEYLVFDLQHRRFHWFDLQNDSPLEPDDEGIYHLKSMPGLWVHGQALLAKDFATVLATLDAGLVSEEHRAFVENLAARR